MVTEKPEDLSDALLAVTEYVTSGGRMQRQLLNPTIVLLSDIYD